MKIWLATESKVVQGWELSFSKMSDDKQASAPVPYNRFVAEGTVDRQWDCRFNVQNVEDLDDIVRNIERDVRDGKLGYVLVGGPEVGDNPRTDDYCIRHVHVAAIFVNRISKSAILRNWGIKRGNGYYLVPRNRNLPYSGWRSHHTKLKSKEDPGKLVILEEGSLPKDAQGQEATFAKRSDEEKKRKLDDILIEMKGMYEAGEDDKVFTKFPRTCLQYGEKIKAMLHQKKLTEDGSGDPHIWLWGGPGFGKSAVLSYIYPSTYKKNLYNRFFDLYDPSKHTHVMLEDLDHDAVDKLSTNFIKTLCDEGGFAVDQKYKTPQLARASILVTSNFSIQAVIHQSNESNVFGKDANCKAICRRFWQIEARELLKALSLKLISKYEIAVLKKNGNADPGKLFMTWDYLTDTPKCEPLKKPEEYAAIIKELVYG